MAVVPIAPDAQSGPLFPPADEIDHADLTLDALDSTRLVEWASVPSAGAVVAFLGIVRDHAEGRDDVTALTYEAYEEPARRRLAEILDSVRARWPDLVRVALVHRLGRLELSEASVVVVVSAPHRREAFEAARFCIDVLKETVPIWKQEHWSDGEGWGTGARPIEPIAAFAEPTGDG